MASLESVWLIICLILAPNAHRLNLCMQIFPDITVTQLWQTVAVFDDAAMDAVDAVAASLLTFIGPTGPATRSAGASWVGLSYAHSCWICASCWPLLSSINGQDMT